jgi:hypothetical protein
MRSEANWACKSESRMALTEASPPTPGGEDGGTEAHGGEWRTTSAQLRAWVGRGEPSEGEHLRGEGERPTGERRRQLRSR